MEVVVVVSLGKKKNHFLERGSHSRKLLDIQNLATKTVVLLEIKMHEYAVYVLA